MVQVLHYNRRCFLDYIHTHYCNLRPCRRILMDILYKYRYIIIFVFILALGIIYYIFDPSASIIFPKCPVMSITGYPCAGCGSQRAIHSLLHLNLHDAIRYNFLVVLFIPIVSILIFASAFKTRFPKLYLLSHHPIVAYGLLIIIILWWVLRIYFGWYI